MKKHRSLVIMAAGIGARFKGGVKQLKRVGPGGECLMDYAIYDAAAAGFNQIIFIIRKELKDMFDDMVGNRVRTFCDKKGIRVDYAYQELDDLPDGYTPGNRTKPWGTGHAILCCRDLIDGPFAVINADDYYGKRAFFDLAAFLDELPDGSRGKYALAGYRLVNTLSDFGGVTRGVCYTDEKDMLVTIHETRHIVKCKDGGCAMTQHGETFIPGNTPVSMNMWAFTPDVLETLQNRFTQFLDDNQETPEQNEFLIPVEIGNMLKKEMAAVRVIETPDKWFGLTYQEDAPIAAEALRKMGEDGVYPVPLF